MRREHDARRSIIREWMSLPRNQRQSPEQAEAFAAKALERENLSKLTSLGKIRSWLASRTGKG